MEKQKAEQDERLLWAWLEAYKGVIEGLEGEPKRFLYEKEATLNDCLQASHVFFLGFPAILDGTIPASEQTMNWVRLVDRRRSSAIQSNQMAITLVAVLETLIGELIEYLCEVPVAAFAARRHVLRKRRATCFPTADERNGRQSWLNGVESLFGITIDPTVAAYLAELVVARNAAAHRLSDDTVEANGETLVNWYLAGKILVWQLSGAAHQMVSK